MFLALLTLSGVAVLGWSSWKLYSISMDAREGKSFCGRVSSAINMSDSCTSCNMSSCQQSNTEPASTYPTSTSQASTSQARVEHKINFLKNKGANTQEVESSLNKLEKSILNDETHVVLLGDISSGKSSLINALIPQAKLKTSVIGGTTRRVNNYHWRYPQTDKKLYLIDLPGLNEVDGALENISLQAVQWGHIVIFICDADLTQTQINYLQQIIKFKKPVIIAINKSDRYQPQELAQIHQLINSRIKNLSSSIEFSIVEISSGGQREVIKLLADGSEHCETQTLPAQLDELYPALEKLLNSYSSLQLNAIRTQEIYSQLFDDLNEIERIHLTQQAKSITQQHGLLILQLFINQNYRPDRLNSAASKNQTIDDKIFPIHQQLIKQLLKLSDIPFKVSLVSRLQTRIEQQSYQFFSELLTFTNNVIQKNSHLSSLSGNLLYAGAHILIIYGISQALLTAYDKNQSEKHQKLEESEQLEQFNSSFKAYLNTPKESDLVADLTSWRHKKSP